MKTCLCFPIIVPCVKILNMGSWSKFQSLLLQGRRYIRIFILVVLMAAVLGGSAVPAGGLTFLVRAFTRPIEFDFSTWTLEAIGAKLASWGLSLERFLTPQAQSALVLDHLARVQRVNELNAEMVAIYTNPRFTNPDQASQSVREELNTELERLNSTASLAEAVLQTQLMAVIQESSLHFLGQVSPPSLYRVNDVPQSLVISPRTEIRQILDISLTPSISVDQKDQLESIILTKLDHSALVVPIGGIGSYPTMVMQSSDLVWMTEVVAHEWVHNFLTLRPLGINYFTSDVLRTINETTATLAGQELGRMILEKYYPDHLPPPVQAQVQPAPSETVSQPDEFNYQTEMRLTRVETDRLLAEGDVEGAEAYMEARRQVFWENGYPIRKLNQAYFAFYGAYSADPEGGAAGEDPVGPAVQALRAQYDQLADFLNAISWVTSFDDLLKLLGR
ncbi:MAG: hypothetical protein WCY93_03470 [Anaerolineaceae bacterium]